VCPQCVVSRAQRLVVKHIPVHWIKFYCLEYKVMKLLGFFYFIWEHPKKNLSFVDRIHYPKCKIYSFGRDRDITRNGMKPVLLWQNNKIREQLKHWEIFYKSNLSGSFHDEQWARQQRKSDEVWRPYLLPELYCSGGTQRNRCHRGVAT